MRAALALGRLQAAYARDFRDGGVWAKALVFWPWLVSRVIFLVLYGLACARYAR